MKQFEKMGWIRQGFLGLIVCAVMSPSHAMSVRERYLLQHPQAAVHQEAAPAKAVKHAHKHHAVRKELPVRQEVAHHRHAKAEQTVAKRPRVNPIKSHHQRVIVPKHTKSKFDQQQARDAAAALNHRKVKPATAKPVTKASRHQHHVAKKEPVKHVHHTATKKHHHHH